MSVQQTSESAAEVTGKKHFCTKVKKDSLRWKRVSFDKLILEQASCCLECGKVSWEEVPTIEEGGK
jgi:hypothetical protein